MKQASAIPAASAGTAILQITGLHKVREQGDLRFELEVPDFALHAGEFIAIVGDSGCGKSTLLDMLALVLQPSRCESFMLSTLAGHRADIWQLWRSGDEGRLAEIRRRDLGYVLQTGGLLPFLSVADNIRLPMRILGAPVVEQTIVELAERIGIRAVLSKKPQHLSGGQRQRAAILRALVHNPRIILADEPTAAVDKKRARAIVADFQILARDRGTTIVMVTHDRDLVDALADATYTFDLTQATNTEVHSVCYRQEG